ncbi:MAG: lipoate--protein ligase family protein, partial [Novipirellula sp. JB048]
MRTVPFSLSRASHQLALDETLLLIAEEQTCNQAGPSEFIRVWEFEQLNVILGRSSRVHEEVDVDFCQSRSIPILRRCSGGATVVGGPGCLMYSVVLDLNLRPALARIDETHQFVMHHLQTAVNRQFRNAAERAQFQG